MKKKLLMAVLSLCIVMSMTACGNNADTEEVVETTATEDGADVSTDTGTQEETGTQEQEGEETQAQEEVDEYYEAGRKSLYGLDGAQINLEDAYANFIKSQELGNTDANFYLGLLADWYSYPEQDYEEAKAAAKEYYEQSGDNPYAQVALGVLYYYGQGVEEDTQKGEELFQSAVDKGAVEGYYGLAIAAYGGGDYETALEYYNKVVEEGGEQFFITNAMRTIGDMYAWGNGVEKDEAKALEWYTKAADSGDTSVMSDVGDMYARGWGFEQDAEKALEWYTKAADSGDESAMCAIGDMYAYGDGVAQDIEKAAEWYTKAADLGDASGLYNLGSMYYWGNGVEQDMEKVIEWYTKAADLGNTEAMIMLGVIYRDGDGVAQDIEKAIEWYTKAADSGDTYGLVLIGSIYEYGNGVAQDGEKAIEWYTKAVDLGDTEAMRSIASMYKFGNGVAQDGEKAIEWYTKAADLGDAEAMRYIGYMYRDGDGVAQDSEKAIEWFVKTIKSGDSWGGFSGLRDILGGYDATLEWFIESGDTEAMIYIGDYYENSYGSNIEGKLPDYDKAMEWYQKAADLGSEEAQEYLERTQEKMQRQ
ncbi:MAG: SEL1-like repeat protein [Clostridiales bacterium]|nr:SEL1-like repeat protein [Clostridiales bacterium]